jgi:hypothetical protein
MTYSSSTSFRAAPLKHDEMAFYETSVDAKKAVVSEKCRSIISHWTKKRGTSLTLRLEDVHFIALALVRLRGRYSQYLTFFVTYEWAK